ncbi:hypothetical protein CA11_13410 [Gimesia maris]|nr:hypothetical protein CA11_13410 [Gimesia maris]
MGVGDIGSNPVRAQRAGGPSCSDQYKAMPPTSSFQKMRIALKPDTPITATSCCLTTTPDYIRGHPRIVDSYKISGGTGCNPVRAQRAGGLSCSDRFRAMPPNSSFQKMRIALRPDTPITATSCCLTTTPDYIRGHPIGTPTDFPDT